MSKEIKVLEQLAGWYEHDDTRTEEILRDHINRMGEWLIGVASREDIGQVISSVNSILVMANPILMEGNYLGGRIEARRNLASHTNDVATRLHNEQVLNG